MDILASIQAPLEGEMQQLNRTIRTELNSSNALLNRVIESYLQTKGKQMRPLLVFLAAQIVGNITPTTMQAAIAIELLHNASLIHDDVVDESNLRRGERTINSLYDNKMAVLTGDYFVSTALSVAVQTQQIMLINIMAQLGKSLAKGEVEQLDFKRSHTICESDYFHMISQKTASLFVACVQAGMYSSIKDYNPALEAYAYNLGVCFQIRDDIFDYHTMQHEIGKPTFADIIEGKVTLPLIFTLQQTDIEERQVVLDLLCAPTRSNEQASRIAQFAIDHGGIEYAQKVMQSHVEAGKKELQNFAPSAAHTALEKLLDYTLLRTK